MSTGYLFTSESVSEGHPDKVADQISDAVLDAILAQDKRARVACETLVKTGVAIVAGEVTTEAWVDLERSCGATISTSATTHSDVGFDGATCGVLNIIGKQSPDIARASTAKDEEAGCRRPGPDVRLRQQRDRRADAGAICSAHRLVERQAEVRKKGLLPGCARTPSRQVTCRYETTRPVGSTPWCCPPSTTPTKLQRPARRR
jgi:S-adenosylmethionine synthetase